MNGCVDRISHRLILRLLCAMMLLVMLAALVGCVREKRAGHSSGSASNDSAFAELDEFKPADILLIVDQSGSMDNTTDKSGLRREAARFFVDYLGVYSTKQQDHRVGVVNFGTDAPVEQAVALSSARTQADSIKSRINATNMSSTNFLAAFKTADSLFSSASSYAPSRQPAIVIFTDGEPDTGAARGPALFPDITAFAKERFISQKCPIYVVAIDSENRYWPRSEPYWKSIATNTYRLSSVSDLDTVFHHIIANIVGFGWIEVPPPGPGQSTKVDVEPYLERVSFTIMKQSPNVKLRITRPNGKVVSSKDSDVIYRAGEKGGRFETYSIIDPTPGTWRLELDGAGTVRIFKDALRLSTSLAAPTTPYPLKRPMNVVVNMARRDGSPLKPLPEYPLHASVTIVSPGKPEPFYSELVRDPSAPSRYVAAKILPVTEPGMYRVTVSVKGGDYNVFEKTSEIQVGRYPYLEIVEPTQATLPMRSTLAFTTKLMLDGKPVSAESQFAEDPAGIAMFRLATAPDLNEPVVDFMKPVTEGSGTVFTYKVSHPALVGTYISNLRLTGKLKDGTSYRSIVETIVIEKKPTILDKLSSLWLLLVCLGLLCVAAYWFWTMRLPLLKGKMEVQGNDVTMPRLRGKRMPIGLRGADNLGIGMPLDSELGYLRGAYAKDDYGQKIVVPAIWRFNSPRQAVKSRKSLILLLALLAAGTVASGVYHWTLMLSWLGLAMIAGTVLTYRTNWSGYDSGTMPPGESKQVGDATLTYMNQ